MKQGLIVALEGVQTPETAAVLVRRLVELGRNAELVDAATAARVGGPEGAAHLAGALARNGVVVVVSCTGVAPDPNGLAVEISEHDTPDFAAEKILDELAEAGAVDLDQADYSPEEEARIRQRLADLGYIE